MLLGGPPLVQSLPLRDPARLGSSVMAKANGPIELKKSLA